MAAETLLLTGEQLSLTVAKTNPTGAIIAKVGKALSPLIHLYRSSCCSRVTFSLNSLSFLVTLSMSKFLSLVCRDLRALLLAGFLKAGTESDKNMRLHKGKDCQAKGKQNRILQKVKL